MDSERTPSGASRARPQATPGGITRSPAQPVPAQPSPSTSTAGRVEVSTPLVASAHTREAQNETDEIILRLCSYCGQTWREGFTARCGMRGQCNAGRGGPCIVERYRVVAWEEASDA